MSASTPHSWEMEGQRLAAAFDDVFAAVVSGTDPLAAASVAIGIARVQGTRRRVAVADLVGEAPPLQSLLTSDDPHGISDSFLYGVSLNKIAQPVNESGNVFIMPSGTEAVALDAVYANERWRRLAAGFHEVGALLLIVAVPGTPGFAALCAYVGALLPVGDSPFPLPAGVPLIVAPAPPPAPPPHPAGESAARARAAASDNPDRRRNKLIASFVSLGAVALAIGAFWPQIRERLPAPLSALFAGASVDTTTVVVPPTPMDSTSRDSLLDPLAGAAPTLGTTDSGVAAAPATPPPEIANAADSSNAARFSIYVATANTRDAAMPEARIRALAAVAMSPIPEGNEPWFRVTVGAATTRAAAEQQLAQLRADKLVGSGSVVSVPFALRLEAGVAKGVVDARLAEYTRRGLMTYALQQADGSTTLYTGAFESPIQAAMLADSLRALGITPVLVYRTGRTF